MAATVLIRVSVEARDKFARFAEEDHTSIREMVDAAANKIERERFWKNYREAFEKLKADPAEWAAYQEEITAWDATLMDGLEEYPFDYGAEGE